MGWTKTFNLKSPNGNESQIKQKYLQRIVRTIKHIKLLRHSDGVLSFFVMAMQHRQCLIAMKLWISTAVHGQAITPTGSKLLKENNDLFIFVQ